MPSPILRLATIAALSWSAAMALAQTVTPPPLPPGHNLVRPSAGLNEDEKKRYVRAHHHKMHNKKDVTRDDSVAGAQPGDAASLRATGATSAGSSGTGLRAGAGAGATTTLGGAGTGPAREKTDKAASGYFFGNNKK